jgi:hypothetical protein
VCGSAAMYGSAAVGGSALCAAMCAAVCDSVWQCARQCAAVRLVVCSSAAVPVWQCSSVLHCGSGWQCAVCDSARGSERQCVAVRVAVFGCPAVRQCQYGSALGSVWQCAWQCFAAVRQCVAVCGNASGRRSKCVAAHFMYILHKVAHKTCSLTGAGGMSLPKIPRILIATDQYEPFI